MYIIQEIQTFADHTVHLLDPVQRDDIQEAESVFHQKLGYAAVSTLPVHAVVILDETGDVKKREFYTHMQEGEPDA